MAVGGKVLLERRLPTVITQISHIENDTKENSSGTLDTLARTRTRTHTLARAHARYTPASLASMYPDINIGYMYVGGEVKAVQKHEINNVLKWESLGQDSILWLLLLFLLLLLLLLPAAEHHLSSHRSLAVCFPFSCRAF